MADGIEAKMVGANELIQSLREFREDVAVRTVRSSVNRIGKFVSERLRTVVPVATGKLLRNIAVRSKYIKSRGVVAAKVTVSTRGKAGDPKNAFYWRFVEFDRKARSPKTGGAPRTIKGQGFVQSTMTSAQPIIAQMFYADLQAAIDRAKRRNARQGGVLSR